MFEELFKKLSEFESHHQIAFSILAIIGIVCFSWGTEKILEEFIFHKKTVHGYFIAMAIGLVILFLTSYFVLKLA